MLGVGETSHGGSVGLCHEDILPSLLPCCLREMCLSLGPQYPLERHLWGWGCGVLVQGVGAMVEGVCGHRCLSCSDSKLALY